MYISRIRLRNIRCIDNLEIDLRSRATTNSALLLLGNNGVGKSTILKSIALGLCDRGGASGLLTDMYGNLLKNGQEEGLIELFLSSGKDNYTLKTTIERVVGDPGQEVLKTNNTGRLPLETSVCLWVRPGPRDARNPFVRPV